MRPHPLPLRLWCLLWLALSMLFSNGVYAETWRQHLPQAKMLGGGEFRWWGFSIYTAKLWQQTPNKDGGLDQAATYALEITYSKSISRERFVDSSIEEIIRLHGNKYNAEKLDTWRQYMEKAFIDVKSGDQLIGVFLPGLGCRFYSQQKLLAEIPDEAFASAFFSIWLDPRTKDTNLRQQLLGPKRSSMASAGPST
ncbi:chalcone isomerase family protein [Undibacterium sp. Ji22W]|uniref:chalcone isomerase family protein n=1 Tax=Undibacterium sp. Ji22W TaxID=3413038 RepID=UPI003BF1D3B6